MASIDLGVSEPLFLGIDGGGTKTLAVVMDADGRERARAQAGGTNARVLGAARAAAQVVEVARAAAVGAGGSLPLAAAWIGLAGLDSAGAVEAVVPHLQGIASQVRVTNDAELLLSALEGSVGVALVAGTGSIALGQDECGRITRAGGWGELLGDEGSAYDIARQALRAAVRAADRRGARTILLERILTHWGLESPSDLIGRVHHPQDRAPVADLAPLVLAAASAGDRVAGVIVRRAAHELAVAVLAVDRAVGTPGRGIRLAVGGGLLVQNARFRELVVEHIRRRRLVEPPIVVAEPALSAARASTVMGERTLAHALPSRTSARQ